MLLRCLVCVCKMSVPYILKYLPRPLAQLIDDYTSFAGTTTHILPYYGDILVGLPDGRLLIGKDDINLINFDAKTDLRIGGCKPITALAYIVCTSEELYFVVARYNEMSLYHVKGTRVSVLRKFNNPGVITHLHRLNGYAWVSIDEHNTVRQWDYAHRFVGGCTTVYRSVEKLNRLRVIKDIIIVNAITHAMVLYADGHRVRINHAEPIKVFGSTFNAMYLTMISASSTRFYNVITKTLTNEPPVNAFTHAHVINIHDNIVYVNHLGTGNITKLVGHTKQIISVTDLPIHRFVTASLDGTVRVWD